MKRVAMPTLIGIMLMLLTGCSGGDSASPAASNSPGSAPSGSGPSTSGSPPTPSSSSPLPSAPPQGPVGAAELPRESVDTGYARPGGQTIVVNGGSDLQAAINDANPGDVIELQAGAVFTGSYSLPNKGGDGWIYIQSSALSSLPGEGARISPAYSGSLPKIISPDTSPAVSVMPGAHHYRFAGVEIATSYASTSGEQYNVILLDDTGVSSIDQLPHHIIIDRCYVHGTTSGNVRRGLAMNGRYVGVVDSYFSDFHEIQTDAQAIVAWNGPGPFKIANSHLEGAAENVLFGGAAPRDASFIPQDITIERNHFYKQPGWQFGSSWTVKNLFEIKNAKRVFLNGNVLEYNWAQGQDSTAVVITPRNEDGSAPYSTVEDVTITNNVIRNSGSGIRISAEDDLFQSQQTQRVAIKNNLFYDIDSARFGGNGRLLQITSPNRPALDLLIQNNTMVHGPSGGGAFLVMGDNVVVGGRVEISNNLATYGSFGVTGNGAGVGMSALNRFLPGATFQNNGFIGGLSDASLYPSGTVFTSSIGTAGFADANGGDYRLVDGSPFKNLSIGADVATVFSWTSGVVQ